MKKLLLFTIGISLTLIILSGCNSSSSNTEGAEDTNTITLKIGSYGADDSVYHELAVKPWMNKVEEITDGQVEFEFYPSEQLGKIGDLLKLTQDKVADIGSIGINNYADELPYSNMIGGLPGSYENSHQGVIAYKELINNNSEVVKTDYTNNGVKFLLGYVMSPYQVFSTDKKITLPNDLKGVQIQATGKMRSDMLAYMEATPSSITFADSYEAMERGVVEATLYGANPIQTSGVGELVNYHLPVGLGSTIIALTINEEVWEDLPGDVQEAMNQAADEITETLGEKFDEAEEKNMEQLTNSGLETVELTENEKEEWDKLINNFNEKWLEENNSQGLQYENVLNEFREIVEEIN